jgi:hypothetical protein
MNGVRDRGSKTMGRTSFRSILSVLAIYFVIMIITIVFFLHFFSLDLFEEEDTPEQNDKLWEQSFDEDISLTDYVYPYQVPRRWTLIIDPAFAYTETGTITALNFTDGSVMWEQSFGEPFSFPPAVSGESLFIFTDDRVYCYNPVNGTEIWKATIPGFGHVAPLFDIDSIFLLTRDEVLYSFTLEGQIEWFYQIEGGVRNSIFANDRFLVWNDDHGQLHCYDLKNASISHDHELDVDGLWIREHPSSGISFGEITTRSGGFMTSRKYHELLIIWDRDRFALMHASTGDEYWSRNFNASFDFAPSVFFSHAESSHPRIRSIILTFEDDTIEALLPSGTTVWGASLSQPIILPPRMSDSNEWNRTFPNLFLASNTNIRVIDGSDGSFLTDIENKDGLRSITLSDDQLIISTGRKVISYHNRFATPRDYSGSSTPIPLPLVPFVIATVYMSHHRRKRQ